MDRQCVLENNKITDEAGRSLSCWMRSCDKALMQLFLRKSPAASPPTPPALIKGLRGIICRRKT